MWDAGASNEAPRVEDPGEWSWKAKLRIALSNVKNAQYIKPVFSRSHEFIILGIAHGAAQFESFICGGSI